MIQHSAPVFGPEEEAAVARVLRSGRVAQGPEVEAFEKECAEFVGRRHAVAVSSGTAALHLALGALGVEKDQPVAVPSYACAALITAIGLQGARPVLVDIGDDYNMDPAAVPEDAAAIAVHLFGAPAHLPKNALAVEDIAQSFGGPTGRATPVAVTSFYATKLMTTGEGGMVFCDDPGMAEFVRDRRDYDNREEFHPRNNYKMTELQAAVGRVQLKRLPGFIARRRQLAGRYSEALAETPLRLPPPQDGHMYFRYVVATDTRDALEAHLNGEGIEAKRPVYRPAHHYLGGEYPRSEAAHRECLSIPVHPALLENQGEVVIKSIRQFFEKRA